MSAPALPDPSQEYDRSYMQRLLNTLRLYFTGQVDPAVARIDSSTFILRGYLEGTEIIAPSAGAANTGRLFFQDNGAGKTQLMVIFATGAAQQIAIQP